MITIRELVHDKINEVFLEYQKANNIISGDITPEDALILENFEEAFADHIERICSYQPKAINYDDLTPSWFIYTDRDGNAYSQVFKGDMSDDFFFGKVSKKICFDDLDDETVVKIYFKGKEVEYAGWQPGMKYEYKDLDGNTVWVGYFEEWDH